MMIDNLTIAIPISSDARNVPMAHNSSCNASEAKNIGPLVRSALPHYERKVDMMGSSVSRNFADWGMEDQVSSIARHFGLQSKDVSLQANSNLSGAQKELMLWHLKLGVSMNHIQRLMKVLEMHEPTGKISVMDRAIVPKLSAAANCDIPQCQLCNLS